MNNIDAFIKTDIENSLLSALIFDNNELFNHEFHSDLFTSFRINVFSEIKAIISSGLYVDIGLLVERLTGQVRASDIVGISEAPVSLNPGYYIEILEQARTRREMYSAYKTAVAMCIEGKNPVEIDSVVKSRISNIETFEPVKSSDLITAVMDDIDKEASGEIEIGIKTGLRRIDYILNGFMPGEFIIIAARPGVGKTSLALNFARNFAYHGNPGIIFSLEMTKKQLVRRMICDVGSVDGSYMFQNKLNKSTSSNIWANIHEASSTISEMPITWDDSARMSIDKIYSRARKAKAVNGIKWVIVDYLQLIHGWNVQGQESKSAITSDFKNMSKELELPVFVLSQLNRNIEGRVNKAPQMSDLRDAGSIEQDCDIAIFPDVPLKSAEGTSEDQYEQANLYLVKTRRGRTGVIKDMRWQGHYYRYSD